MAEDSVDIEALERLAVAATPGPWQRCFHLESEAQDKECPCGYRGSIWSGDGELQLLEMDAGSEPGADMIPIPERKQTLANAAYIAACHPQAILSLIQRVREAERLLREAGRVRNDCSDALLNRPALGGDNG